MRRVLFVGCVLALATAMVAGGREYRVSGDIALRVSLFGGDAVEVDGREFGGDLRLRLDHRLHYEWGELSLTHRAIQAGAGSSTANRTEAVPGVEALSHELTQAAVTLWPVDSMTAQIGRFSMPWGVGYLFFPGDALHPPRTLDGQAVGFDGAALTWTPSADWGIAAAARADTAYASGDQWYRDLRWAAQAFGYAGRTEMVLATVYQPGVTLRPSVGLSPALGPVVLHFEGAVELAGSTEWAVSAGGNSAVYPGRHSVTLVADYLYATEPQALYATEPQAGLGNHALYLSLSWDRDARVSLEQSALIDPTDGRSRFASSAVLSLFDALDFQAEAVFAYDGVDTVRNEAVSLVTRVYF